LAIAASFDSTYVGVLAYEAIVHRELCRGEVRLGLRATETADATGRDPSAIRSADGVRRAGDLIEEVATSRR
jgi:hypothetical protein